MGAPCGPSGGGLSGRSPSPAHNRPLICRLDDRTIPSTAPRRPVGVRPGPSGRTRRTTTGAQSPKTFHGGGPVPEDLPSRERSPRARNKTPRRLVGSFVVPSRFSGRTRGGHLGSVGSAGVRGGGGEPKPDLTGTTGVPVPSPGVPPDATPVPPGALREVAWVEKDGTSVAGARAVKEFFSFVFSGVKNRLNLLLEARRTLPQSVTQVARSSRIVGDGSGHPRRPNATKIQGRAGSGGGGTGRPLCGRH